jgi:hypothetical protein
MAVQQDYRFSGPFSACRGGCGRAVIAAVSLLCEVCRHRGPDSPQEETNAAETPQEPEQTGNGSDAPAGEQQGTADDLGGEDAPESSGDGGSDPQASQQPEVTEPEQPEVTDAEAQATQLASPGQSASQPGPPPAPPVRPDPAAVHRQSI